MKKRLIFGFIILSILLLICYYKFGLFTPYNYFTAKYDLMKGNIRVLYYGDLTLEEDLKSEIAKERGFKYERVEGWNVTYELENGVESYNSVVNDYLTNKLGKDWKKEFEKDSEMDYSNRDKVFPGVPFKYVKAYSIIKELRDAHVINDTKILPYMENMGGFSFIDSTGKPLHQKFESRNLTTKEISIINSSLKLPSKKDYDIHACIPVYRDALIYYDSLNKPVAYLNICFECGAIVFYPQCDIDGNDNVVNGLYTLFKEH